jgi:general secretion pathway protein K
MNRVILTRQRGVAVITALLLTTLAITIVASLFWQQQVQVRSIENQRLQLQKQWVLRGALDWARLILREDKRITTNVDSLDEPWAVPLAETRLDQYVENARADSDVPDAVLSGGIVDAQSRLNLTNLCQGGEIKEGEVGVFATLLKNQQQNPELALATARLMASAQKKTTPSSSGTVADTSAARPMDIRQVDDLLAVPGFTPEALAAIRDFVVVLPVPTPVNVNTAPAEVLVARVDTLSPAAAAAFVTARRNAALKSPADLAQWVSPKDLGSGKDQISVGSNYFLVNGNVRLNRAGMEMQALIDRTNVNPEVLWIRQN